MALRTSDQYKAALRDGRTLFIDGHQVDDVTTFPRLRVVLAHAANIYELASSDPEEFTIELDGETTNRYFEPLTSPEALRRRSALIEEHTRRSRSTFNITKAVGTDALAGLHTVSAIIDEAEGTNYHDRVKRYAERCRREDLSIALAQTDVKGDRRLLPHQQADPDLHVRIVETSDDGITVRGAKAHTTMTPFADEIVVLPTRAYGPEDKSYAVAFAVPVATAGLTMICGPLQDPDRPLMENPVSGRNLELETLTIFEDVFVPWDRVFLAGESAWAGMLANTFATFHRFTAISYKVPYIELLIGCAFLVADLNGTIASGHVREKLARMVHYLDLLRACITSAAAQAVPVAGGLYLPDPSSANAGKLHFAENFHEFVRTLQDLAGGATVTVPGSADLHSEATGSYVRKYFVGTAGTDPDLRIALFHLIRDLTASAFGGFNQVVTLHGEGSMQAQLLHTLREADLESAFAAVEEVLGNKIGTRRILPDSALPLLSNR